MAHLSLTTPIGALSVFADDDAILAVEWGRAPGAAETPLLLRARDQLDAYFDGRLTAFDIPLRLTGTPLQRSVWRAMQDIAYGTTRTYGDLARDLGTAAQTVGQACGRNPIPVIVPCHRVLGAGGRMTGYSGGAGVDTKSALLRLEGAVLI